MTLRESILEYIVTLLTPIQNATLFRSREAAISRAEGVGILVMPEEEPVENRAGGGPSGLVLRNLTVIIAVIARADGGPQGKTADQVADPMMQAIHQMLMADTTLGGLVATTIEQSTKWDFELADGTALAAEMRYLVRYQTRANSLSQ